MFEILKMKHLAANNYEMRVNAPRIASSCLPGQFLIVIPEEDGERIPLTIADYDRENGTVDIVFQTIGTSTYKMAGFKEGDSFADIAGPLGRPSDLTELSPEELKKKKIVFIAGGVGAAPVYPQAKWLKEQGVDCDVIMGFRTKDIIFWEDRMKEVANVYVTTDDGSYGRNGMVTKCLEDLISEGHEYDHCVVIGPMIMMKFACLLTQKLGIKTIVSMNPIMVDGTGMCGACRVTVGGEVKFACVDGPEFDGSLINFDEAMRRQTLYKTEEGRKLLEFQEGDSHTCGNKH
ncbi:MAG: sulfide/dihydroorotate dehydrogenase-like FAD/NAD-binding protein [Lachnospiraceae bacterium]|nr:sulfide/dihydroorotate dehydrogenase-like FAD/NAD-binding protein [Lachnospiraceae bacterium]